MCLSCGCDQPNDDHGDADQVTFDELKRAADANGISVEQAANNIATALTEV
ncbi:MAG: hypothetical protein ACXWXQ_10055 [Actinomycetota bacterium]